MIVLFSHKLYFEFRMLTASHKKWKSLVFDHYPTLLVLFLFLFIPYFARAIWFLHYAFPLLCVLLLYSPSIHLKEKWTRVLIFLGVATNIVTFVIVVTRNGSVYINGYEMGIQLQLGIFTVAVSCVYIILVRLRNM